MDVTNQILLDEIRANRAEIHEVAKKVAALEAGHTDSDRRIGDIESNGRKTIWALLTAGLSLLVSVILAGLRFLL